MDYRLERQRGEVADDRYGVLLFSVEEYFATDAFGAQQFAVCREGQNPDGTKARSVQVHGRTLFTHRTMWERRWTHMSNRPKDLPAIGVCHMPWYRKAVEGEYHQAMRPIVQRIINREVRYARDSEAPLLVRGPMDGLYFIEEQGVGGVTAPSSPVVEEPCPPGPNGRAGVYWVA